MLSECFLLHKCYECLTIVQVSVLTDQVEVQGEKIRDLDNCLEHHREKLNATEELLQHVRPLQSHLMPNCDLST